MQLSKIKHINVEQKKVILELYLEQVADQLGDITQPVIDQYYADYPAA